MLLADYFSLDGAIGALAIVIAAFIPVWWSTRSARRSVKSLHDEVRTNHGKKAYEYLEMVGEIKADMTAMHGQLDSVGKMVGAQEHSFTDLLARHTAEDQERFDVIIERLDEIQHVTDVIAEPEKGGKE